MLQSIQGTTVKWYASSIAYNQTSFPHGHCPSRCHCITLCQKHVLRHIYSEVFLKSSPQSDFVDPLKSYMIFKIHRRKGGCKTLRLMKLLVPKSPKEPCCLPMTRQHWFPCSCLGATCFGALSTFFSKPCHILLNIWNIFVSGRKMWFMEGVESLGAKSGREVKMGEVSS